MVLFVIPQFDLPTQYTASWAQYAVDLCKKSSMQYAVISGKGATRSGFEKAVSTHSPELVVHFDHGTPEALLGDGGQPIYDGQNLSVLQGRMVYSFSCQSASRLGRQAMGAGVRGWLGYSVEVGFNVKILDWMRMIAIAPIQYLLRGFSLSTTYESLKSLYDLFIDRARIAKYSKFTRAWLAYNREGLTLLGEGKSTLSKRENKGRLILSSVEFEDSWWTPIVPKLQPQAVENDEEVTRVKSPVKLDEPERPFAPWVPSSTFSSPVSLHTREPFDISEPQAPPDDSEENRFPERSPFEADRPRLWNDEISNHTYTEHPEGRLPAGFVDYF